MATLNGINYAKSLQAPVQKADPGEINAKVKCIRERYTLSAVLANGDEILGPILPAGAVILDAYVKSPSLGATGIVTLGLKAFTDYEGNTEAADPDSLVVSADAGGAAVLERASAGSAAIGKKVGTGGAQTVLTCTEASANAVGTIEYVITYALEA